MDVQRIHPKSEEARRAYTSYLMEITETFGYDSTRGAPTTDDDFVPPNGCLLVVRDEAGGVIGCGGVRLLAGQPATAEVKRMWLAGFARGRGIGRVLLARLEDEARELGAQQAVLDTNEALTAALSLYRSAGWEEVPAYNDNREATHWFAKDLTTARATQGPTARATQGPTARATQGPTARATRR